MPPVSRTEPVEQIASEQYLLGRMFAGCASLQQEGSWSDADETFAAAIDFGERQIFTHEDDGSGGWIPIGQISQMPVVVVSSNAHELRTDGGNCEPLPSGVLAAHVYLAQSQIANAIWHGPNFFGAMLRELWEQTADLNSPGTYFADRTLPIDRIEMVGPTRTPIDERGKDGENDYWDAVFMIYWKVD